MPNHRTTFRLLRSVIAVALILLIGARFASLRMGGTPVKNPVSVAADQKDKTALMLAVSKGDIARVKALLDQGVDVNAKDKRGRTALMVAASGRQIEIVQALIDKGANANARNKDRETALMMAVKAGVPYEPLMGGPNNFDNAVIAIVKALLKGGANVDLKNKKGETALMMAQWFRNPEAIRLLQDAQAKSGSH